MANSKKPATNKPQLVVTNHLLQQLEQALLSLPACSKPLKLLVAYSGGLDSSVLLHALHALQSKFSYSLSVAHVHHGLSPNADAWVDFCHAQTVKICLPFYLTRVSVEKNGLGIEAAARQARYTALEAHRNQVQADYICLAHHANDQAETLLLQLARGAGAKGLAGMAQHDSARYLFRPLLGLTRAQLEAYARAQKIDWIEDESNLNVQFDRNFMRHEVLPVLEKRYANLQNNIARSALHLAEASDLLDELAQLDAKKSFENHALNIGIFKTLSVARQRNLLRWWLSQHQVLMPNAAHLHQMCAQLGGAKPAGKLQLKVSHVAHIRQYGGLAYWVENAQLAAFTPHIWQGESEIEPNPFLRLKFEEKLGQGVAQKWMREAIIQTRQGGEQLKPELNRPTKTLKTLFQSANIPPWLRANYPLIYHQDTLVAVPNVACDIRFKAAENEIGYVISLS